MHCQEFELVLDKAEHYSYLALVNLKYNNSILAIQIEIFVKHYIQQALYLYSLRTH